MQTRGEDIYLRLIGGGERLPQAIRLDATIDYEAALVKLIYYGAAMNVPEGRIRFFDYARGDNREARVAVGFYRRPLQLLIAFADAIGDQAAYYRLQFEARRAKFKLTLRRPTGATRPPTIEFLSPDIPLITGLPARGLSGDGASAWGERTWRRDAGHESVYVLTDLIEQQIVGDREAPLLAVVNFEAGAGEIEYQPATPIYVPVVRRAIDALDVRLRTAADLPFPFLAPDRTMVVVHVRAKKNL